MSRRGVFGWVILTAIPLFLSASAASAGHGVWTSQGPEGANVQDLVVIRGQPSVLYAAPLEGVFKSVDGGKTWRLVSQAIDFEILSLAGDPARSQTLYVGTSGGGIFKTLNGGRTWKHLDTLGGKIIIALAISRLRTTTVVWAGTTTGLYVSRNAGQSWALVNALPQKIFSALEVHPTREGTVYASGQEGLFKTENGGATWRQLGLTDGFTIGPDALAIDPAHPEKIYIAGQFYSGVFWSEDGGTTWQRPPTEISAYQVRALAVDPASSIVYAATWWFAPQLVYKSLDGGASWQPAGRGLPGVAASSLVLDPANLSTLYAASLAGVWKSTDRGESWSPANRGIRHTTVSSVAIDPSIPGTAYATAHYIGVFKSADRGASWELLGSGLEAFLVHSVAIAPATASSPAALFAGTDRGIFRSTDGGRNWNRLAAGPGGTVGDLTVSPLGVVYAATDEGALRSTDLGETWTLLWPGVGNDGAVRRIVVSPSRPTDLYLTAPSGIYVSFDEGETWTQSDTNNLTAFTVAVDPVRPYIVYASIASDGILKSLDGGLHWLQSTAGLPPSTTISDIAIDPLRPDTLYVSTWFGVYRSLDGGASWAPFQNSNGNPFHVTSLTLDARGQMTLYAGSNENGVFDRTLVNPPPPGSYLVTDALPGYRFKVLVTAPGQPPIPGRLERDCPPETLCVSSATAGRPDVQVRVSGLRPNGYYWLTVTRSTPSQVEIWAERPGTGDRKYYRLNAAPPGSGNPPGRMDRTAFPVR